MEATEITEEKYRLKQCLLGREKIQSIKNSYAIKEYVGESKAIDESDLSPNDPQSLSIMQQRFSIDGYACSIVKVDKFVWDYISIKPQGSFAGTQVVKTVNAHSKPYDNPCARTIAR